MRRPRISSIVFVVVLATASGGLAGGTAVAKVAAIECSSAGVAVAGVPTALVDFDGDGTPDSAILAPGADHGRGAIDIRYGSGAAATTVEPGDGLIPSVPAGSGLTFADLYLNPDGCTDLAVGLPGLRVGGIAGAGAVQLLYGSEHGFVEGPLMTPGSKGIPGPAQAGEGFGTALSWSFTYLTVGVPGWSPTVHGSKVAHAGEALVLALANQSQDPATLGVVTPPALWTRVPHPVAGDRLGSTVGDGYAGAPDASRNGRSEVGCFATGQDIYCGHQAGAELGSSFAQVWPDREAVGAPGRSVAVTMPGSEQVRLVRQAGAVDEFAVRNVGGRLKIVRQEVITQASPGVPGAPRLGNHFGFALSSILGKHSAFAVGIPGMSLPGARHAGGVAVRNGGPVDSPWQLIDRQAAGGAGYAGDDFGRSVALTQRDTQSLSNGDFRLLVGAPGARVDGQPGAGCVQIFLTQGVTVSLTGSQLLTAPGGARTGAHYGAQVR